MHLLALGSFLTWLELSGGDWRLAVNIAAAVLIITCPCALGLAVPAVVTAASGRLYRRGVLIKSATALERLAEIDTVVFDKTGTLTTGAPRLAAPETLAAADLALAAALAGASSHPLALALAAEARARGVAPAAIEDLREVPGYGVEGRAAGGAPVRLGRAEWVGAAPVGLTATYLLRPDATTAAVTFTDAPRAGAAAAVAGLRALGLEVVLVSGDAAPAVAALADALGIADWQAGALPEQKEARIAALASDGRRALMVGDGLNDTAALARAHVSMSPASALDAARVASDMVLLGNDLAVLPDVVATARAATRRIRENFAISAAYNVVAVPIALVGLATPLWAALAMSVSSITVSLNALRLR